MPKSNSCTACKSYVSLIEEPTADVLVETCPSQSTYHSAFHFHFRDSHLHRRVESALQRYAHKRKFHATPANIFNRFMTYGGVESAQRMFTGGFDKADFDGLSKADIATMTATNFVGDDKEPGPDAKWAVDFEAVAKGFLYV
jgi:hypothetical protein